MLIIEVLMIEMDDLARYALYKELRNHNYAVNFSRSNSMESFEKLLHTNVWNVIIMNLDTDSVTIEEVTKKLTDLGVTCPIVAVSGDKSHEARERALSTGAYSYIFSDDLSRLAPVVKDILTQTPEGYGY